MQHIIIKRTDDFQGEGEAKNYQFSLAGKAYEVDLNEENAERFHKVMDEFVGVARPVSQRSTRRAPSKELSEARAWANSQGIPVSKRGRVSKSVLDGFREFKASKSA